MRGLGLGARGTTMKRMARATSGGSDGNDLFDLLSASSSVSGSRPTSPGGARRGESGADDDATADFDGGRRRV